MKKISSILIMFLLYVTTVKSQLQVDTTGYVGVGVTEEILEDEGADSIMSHLSVLTAGYTNTAAFFANSEQRYTLIIDNFQSGNKTGKGLYSSCSTENGSGVGVEGHASTGSGIPAIGVRGLAVNGNNSVGVYGGTPLQYYDNENFAGIYGTELYSPTPYFQYSGIYAGYFHGTVRSTGTMYAQAYLVTSPSLIECGNNDNSSVRLIGEEERVTDKLRNVTSFELEHNEQAIQTRGLDPVEAFLNGRNIKDLSKYERLQLDSIFSEIISIDTDPLASINYGLDAEQLKAMFPKLVQQDKEGNYSINYIEMIPLLVKSINELSEELEELKVTSKNRARLSQKQRILITM